MNAIVKLFQLAAKADRIGIAVTRFGLVVVLVWIVSLKILNDFNGMEALLEGSKDELNGALTSVGFQLSSVTAAPLPDWKRTDPAAESHLPASGDKPLPVPGDYAAKPYKGVDFKA